MKKVIAILAVMIVLVGAVFAAETHTIKVKSTIDEVLPVFQLMIDLTKSADYYTNANKVKFDNGTYAELTEDPDTAKDVEFSLENGGDVTVKCYLANLAKTTHKYTLAFSDGVFAVARNKVTLNQTRAPKSITTSTGDNVEDIYTITKGNALSNELVDPEDETQGYKPLTNQAIEVQFHGKTVETKDVVLAQAVFNYAPDTTIDPGTYFADITLSITTD